MRVLACNNNGMVLSIQARRCVACNYDLAQSTPPIPFVVTPGYAGFKEQVECLACVLRRVRGEQR